MLSMFSNALLASVTRTLFHPPHRQTRDLHQFPFTLRTSQNSAVITIGLYISSTRLGKLLRTMKTRPPAYFLFPTTSVTCSAQSFGCGLGNMDNRTRLHDCDRLCGTDQCHPTSVTRLVDSFGTTPDTRLLSSQAHATDSQEWGPHSCGIHTHILACVPHTRRGNRLFGRRDNAPGVELLPVH
jgi:hypothetical protein